jgi:hypothetical protein
MAGTASRRTVVAVTTVALPLPARTLVATLALVVLLACAGPASAAPRAESSAGTSACTVATKKLRAAKAKLAKVQRQAKRGRASRATLAKARRAVKKATAAKRKACAAPPSPGGTPDGAPGGTPGGTPPPPPGGQPDQPPPPPPPPGDEPTSHALIQKALDEGRIDEETALRYRVFAEFGDDRLPAEFRGAPLEAADTDTLEEVKERWDELSPATRAALDPFFIPPFNPGSWYQLGSPAAQGIQAASTEDPQNPAPPGADLCANTAPDMTNWGYVTAAGGKVRVWYENTVAGQQAKAIAVSDYLDGGDWNKVISVFREPHQDGGDLQGKRCRGFDPSVDMVLSPITSVYGRAIDYFTNGCKGPGPGFMLINRTLTGKALRSTVVHELAHLTHFAYSADFCTIGIAWLTEATAAWTENYVGGLGPEYPERFAPYFLDRPGLPLETYEPSSSGSPRQYGSYLFFQWLSKNRGADALGKVWYYTESGEHPIDTTQLALKDLGYAGGFDEAWKQFALAGMNPREQVDWFNQWGMPRGATTDHDTVFTDGAGSTLVVDLPHLSAQYHELDFSDAVKGIEVKNPFAGDAGASLQAWLQIDDGGQSRVEVRDLSDAETTTFCRDIPAENVQRMVLVFANGTHADRSHKLTGDANVRGTASCGDYDGTSTTTIKRDGLTETYTAAYTMKFTYQALLPGGGAESFFVTESAQDMHASWTISGVSESDGCTYSGSYEWPQGTTGLQARLTMYDYGKGNPETKYEHGFGIPFEITMVHRSCPNGHADDMYHQIGHGFQSQRHPYDPEEQGITGSETQDGGYVVIEHDWSLTRKNIGQ